MSPLETLYAVSTFPEILKDEEATLELASSLEEEAQRLQEGEYRSSYGSPSRWEWLGALWIELASNGNSFAEQDRLLAVALGLARTTRNVVAGERENQREMMGSEPFIRRLLTTLSAYAYVVDERYFPLIRALTQALANLLTGNTSAVASILPVLVQTSFDSNLISRLLASEDLKTLFSVVVLLRNALDVWPAGASLFAERGPLTSGLSITEAILRKMSVWFEVEDGPAEEAAFEAGYEFISHLIEADMMGELFESLKHPSETEPISAAQSTLLKLYDAHSQRPSSIASTSSSARTPPIFLVQTSITYMSYISSAMTSAFASNSNATASSSTSAAKVSPFSDVRFEKVYEALVLVLQGLLRVGLQERELEEKEVEDVAGPGEGEEGRTVREMKELEFIGQGAGGGVIENSLDLLRLADLIEPRLIRTGPVSSETPRSDPSAGPKGFAHLRRDLVRILGLLSYGDKVVQDRVREKGGLEVVLGLCAMDEGNPYLREHSLFTMRCLLVGNAESQDRVKELQPRGVVDEEGQLGDMPERWKNAPVSS
ncbi:spinocerebellar ataxia type 10 protein domain-containing protein [Mrakia frigida]|uniref:Ctr86p n=1 Tax=Mrakia frigida TaxID=29902 RepID=UPI003FCC09E5